MVCYLEKYLNSSILFYFVYGKTVYGYLAISQRARVVYEQRASCLIVLVYINSL